jgi:hypothetical protein
MDIKKYEGKMSIEDFVEGLMSAHEDTRTPGEVWEDCVSCDRCPYKEECKDITEYMLGKDTEIYCSQVIDILFGTLKIEEVQ